MYFPSLAAFTAFLRTMQVREIFVDTAARGAVAELYRDAVKDLIGNAEMLPPPLADATQVERARSGYSPDETLLRSGELRDSYHWAHVSPRKTLIGSGEEKAVWHEFGTTRGVPGRQPLATTAAEKNVEGFEVYNKIIGAWVGKGEARLSVNVERID